MRSTFLSAVLGLVLITSGCGSQDPTSPPGGPAPAKQISVVTTTTVLQDLVVNIGGGLVDIVNVIPPNVDAHAYEPSAADLAAIAKAQVLIRNGAGFERWFERTVKTAETSAAVIDASEGVTLRRTGAEVDPHIWHSPIFAKKMTANISRALQEADPANAAEYAGNERAYQAQLDSLNRETQLSIDSLNNKKFVSNHEAFAHYFEQFGLEPVGSVLPNFDNKTELPAPDLQQLIDRIKQLQVKAIFTDAAVPPKTAEAVVREANVKIVTGDGSLFGEAGLYGDGLSVPGGVADTYIKMIRHNTNVIVTNLM